MALSKKAEIVPILKLTHEKECRCCKYSPNKEFIVTSYNNGLINTYKSQTGVLVNSMSRPSKFGEVPITNIQFRNNKNPVVNNTLLSTYTDGKVILWDLEKGKIIKEIVEERQTLGCVYHPKLPKFLTVGDNGGVYLYDEETMKLEQKYVKGAMATITDGHTSRVFAAQFHPTEEMEFVSGGWDNVVHFWDIRHPNSVRYISGVHMCGEGLDFRPLSHELLTCSHARDNAIQVWNYHTGGLMANIEPDIFKPMLYCGKWLSRDHVIVGGIDPNLLRIVSYKNLTTVSHFKGSTSGVLNLDSCVRSTKTSKKDVGIEMKIIFTMDKSLIEANVTI